MTILFIFAFFNKIKLFFSKKGIIEYGSIAGFVLTMLALSMSKYKLPHYIYIVMPLAAVISAKYVFEIIGDKTTKIIYWTQLVFLILFLGFSIWVIYFFNDYYPMWLILPLAIIAIIAYLVFKKFELKSRIILLSALVGIFINLQLNTSFYPKLLTFQSSSEVAFYVNEHDLDKEKLHGLRAYGHGLSYYLDMIVPFVGDQEQLMECPIGDYFYVRDEGMAILKNSGLNYKIVKEFDEFSVTRLTPKFLNPATRSEATTKAYLIQTVK